MAATQAVHSQRALNQAPAVLILFVVSKSRRYDQAYELSQFFTDQRTRSLIFTRSGLVVRNLFGDWNAGPFEDTRSPEMIFIAQMPEAN